MRTRIQEVILIIIIEKNEKLCQITGIPEGSPRRGISPDIDGFTDGPVV